MGLISYSNISDGTNIDANDVNNPFNTIYDEFNGNITDANIDASAAIAGSKLASASVTSTQINFGGAGAGIWWEEIGRTTLGSSGDAITVSSLPERKYLKVIVRALNSGAIQARIQFNGDTGTNYASRISNNGGAEITAASATSVLIDTGSNNITASFEVMNTSTREKVGLMLAMAESAVGAANIPSRNTTSFKWSNTTNSITQVSIINAGAGDFASGSEVVVLGHN